MHLDAALGREAGGAVAEEDAVVARRVVHVRLHRHPADTIDGAGEARSVERTAGGVRHADFDRQERRDGASRPGSGTSENTDGAAERTASAISVVCAQ